MPFEIWSGKTGAGKSVMLARKFRKLLHRNYRWYKKTGKVRLIYSNTPFNFKVLPDWAPFFVRYFEDLNDYVLCSPDTYEINLDNIDQYKKRVIDTTGIDIIYDELSIEFDSRNWQNMDKNKNKWVKQHRKLELEIYANTQDFNMVDINIRRVTDNLYWLTKIPFPFSSPDPSATKPDFPVAYAFVFQFKIKAKGYEEDKPIQEIAVSKVPRPFLFRPFDIAVYDTRYVVEPTYIKYVDKYKKIDRETGELLKEFYR